MAARIALIVSQPSRRDAAAVDLIENLVAAALLVPGLDANLIGDIERFELGGTDHLCLQGHARDIVLASFLTLDAAEIAWQRLGQSGRLIDFNTTEENLRLAARNGTAVRRVYYFTLSPQQPVSALLDRCRQLLAAQQVPLVNIQFASVGSSQPSLPLANKANGSNASSVNKSRVEEVSSSQRETNGSNKTELPVSDRDQLQPQTAGGTANDADEADWTAIDKLVDDLDALDF